MKCEKVNEKLQAFIDKETSNEVTEEIRNHLRECPFCQNELRNLQRIDDILLSFEDEEVPENLTEKLLNIPYSDKKVTVFIGFKKVSIAASIIISFILGAWISSQTIQDKTDLNLLLSDNTLYSYLEGDY